MYAASTIELWDQSAATLLFVVESSSVADQHPDVPKSPWPVLPSGCPDEPAAQRTGTFYRLVNGTDADWQTPWQVNGEEWCNKKLGQISLCRFHALSVHSDPAQSMLTRTKYPRMFPNHSVAQFEMTLDMGVSVADANAHFGWWPQGSSFVPPPDLQLVPE